MILERLHLENYKQFREPLTLEPPEGAIGVVGANGSGKTTIFEAILWAFFGPDAGRERFRNDFIPWSGGSAKDRTLVQVTLDKNGNSYTVERALQSGKAKARVLADSGDEIVSGPKEVALWVQGHLLSMDRAAFESTFFARQKELEFFSGVRGVDRQREIARLLGINRVESARALLNEDRKEAEKRAKVLEARLDSGSYEKLKEKRESAGSEKEEIEQELEKAGQSFEERGSELEAARKKKELLDEKYREHHRLASELQTARSERQRAADRRAAQRERLEEIGRDEKQIEESLPKLERLPDLTEKVERLEEARRKAERRETARGELARARRRAAEAVHRCSKLLDDLDEPGGEPMPGWDALISTDDAGKQMRRALEVLKGTPDALREAEGEHRRLEKLREEHAESEEVAAKVREQEAARERGRARRAELDGEARDLTGGEDLDDVSKRLREEREEIEREAASLKGAAKSDSERAKDLRTARQAVEHTGADGECPTCQRGFAGDEEHLKVVETLDREIKGFEERAEESLAKADGLAGKAGEISGKIEDVGRRSKEAADIRDKRVKVSARLESLEDDLRLNSERLAGMRERLPDSPPSEEEIQTAEGKVEWLRRIRDAEARVSSLTETREDSEEEAARLETELKELEEVSYDADEHKRLTGEKSELEGLRGSVATMRERISHRPEVERQLEEAGEEELAAGRRAGEFEEKLAELAFDEEAHQTAAAELAKVGERLEEAREKRDGLSREQERLQNRLETLDGGIRRYEEDRKRVDEQAAAASRMGRMNELFKEFYRDLSGRARPALQAEAGEMVRALTDGRYESVEFDENYGLKLFDGLSDAYGIERFSGGEADIVSLSARVALSKVISSRGSDALGFIVLDEVFGALDAGRRHNVLLALDRLKRIFGQIFVISHVGEVQESALLDELWTVEEDTDGKSTVQRLSQSMEDPGVLAGNPNG